MGTASAAPQQAGKRLTGKWGKHQAVTQPQKDGKGCTSVGCPAQSPQHLMYTHNGVGPRDPGQPVYMHGRGGSFDGAPGAAAGGGAGAGVRGVVFVWPGRAVALGKRECFSSVSFLGSFLCDFL